jgi:hypothetical protein
MPYTQFHDPFNREGMRQGSPGLRTTWFLIRGILILLAVWVLFAWPWYLDLPVAGKAVIIAIWYCWIPISFASYVHWNRKRKAELRGADRV